MVAPMSDSSTGGYLLPLADPAPLEGEPLNDFLQGWIVGITGLPGDMVRPRLQAEPPNIPSAGTAWAAIGTQVRPADEFPYVVHNPHANGGLGQDELHQHEDIEILCSFYDLSTNGQADAYAALLRQGTAIDQNLEPLILNGMGLVACGAPVPLPSKLKTRWLYRVDITVTIKREIIRFYQVQNVIALDATLEAENAGGALLTRTITVP
jgi:hypothetical protein